MKQISKRIFPAFLLLLILTGCGYAGPEKAVRQELDLIQNLDESTIKAFVSYENIHLSGGQSQEIGSETTEAVKLFFQNFKYKIRSSSLSDDGDSATVEVSITNIDAQALAKDLCRAMITDSSVSENSIEGQTGLAASFSLMKKCLENHTYDTKTTSATVHLTRQNDIWVIQESAQLEDQLAGGLASYLADPYLLSPDEVVETTLEPFSSFTSQDWINYLDINDIFSTGSALSTQIDQSLAEQIASYFDYRITGVTQDGDTAYVTTDITSLDLESVINQCRTHLLEYACTTESIRASDEELSAKTAQILLDALSANEASATNTVVIQLTNNGHIWETALDDSFADALLGGIEDAVSVLYPSASSSDSES